MVLQKLKDIRISKHYTYEEMGNRTGMSKEGYWMIENGKRKLYYENAIKIAKVFDMNPDDIFLHSELTKTELI